MKVILLENIRTLGKRGDVIEVSAGYARNVLFAKKQAIEATKENLNNWKLRTAHEEKVAAEHLEEAKALAQEMKDWKVEVQIKTGEGGRAFGSVSTKEIAEAVEKQYGKAIDKKKMEPDVPIKGLGVYDVKVKLHPEVTASLRVHVSEKN